MHPKGSVDRFFVMHEGKVLPPKIELKNSFVRDNDTVHIYAKAPAGAHQKFPSPKYTGTHKLKIATWNCNGKWHSDARNFIELQMLKHELDIVLVQETRQKLIRSFSIHDFSYTQEPAVIKEKTAAQLAGAAGQPRIDGRHLSGGLITIVAKQYVVAKDGANSCDDFLVTNVFMERGGYMKVINYYARPSRRKNSMKKLLKMIKRIRKAEPGISILIGGDFNHDISVDGDAEYQMLRAQKLKRNLNTKPTFIRPNSNSKIDFVVADQNLRIHGVRLTPGPSDHLMLRATVFGVKELAVRAKK